MKGLSGVFTVCFLAETARAFSSVAPPSPSLAGAPKSKKVLDVVAIQKESERLAESLHNNRAWNALFVDVEESREPLPLFQAEGMLPDDFPYGALLRIGPNGASPNDGFFDGDGMIHCITLSPKNQGMYTCTYVDTKSRELEAASNGRKRFRGTLGGVPRGFPLLASLLENAINFQTLQAQKDTCNTAIAQHGDRILALMEQCPPSEIVVDCEGRVQTIEASSSLDGAIKPAPITGGALSAHGRTCPETGERIHVTYQSEKPFLRMDTFSPGFQLKHSVGIDLPGAIFLHDIAITSNYVVIMDLPLTLKPERMMLDKFPVDFEQLGPARIGLVPRDHASKTKDVQWFDCQPGVVLHLVNAYEKDNQVFVQGLRTVPNENSSYLDQFTATYLHEYTLDLDTGKAEEQCLNPSTIVEFPIINEKYTGKEAPHVYCARTRSIGGPLEVFRQPKVGLTLGGIVKLALTDGDGYSKGDVVSEFQLAEDWYLVSEATVLPKVSGGNGDYVTVIATHVPPGVSWQDVAKDDSLCTSKVLVLDGENLEAGAVFAAVLPKRVNYGLHSAFVDWESLR